MEYVVPGLSLIVIIWFSTRYAWWRRPVTWKFPRVLMYHMVRDHRPGARFNKLRVPPSRFEAQIAWLAREGFTFVSASRLTSSEPLPEKCVCLTFDDGYRDNLLAADPVLEKYKACATLYLVTDREGGWSSKKKAHHADDELQSEPKLSDKEVRKMLASGRWELGAHTTSHANLMALKAEEAREEISAPRIEMEKLFEHRPATFAYPFGLFDATHPPMLAEAGYQGAVTTEPGIAPHPAPDPMEIPRVKISGKDSLFSFILRIRGGMRGLRK